MERQNRDYEFALLRRVVQDRDALSVALHASRLDGAKFQALARAMLSLFGKLGKGRRYAVLDALFHAFSTWAKEPQHASDWPDRHP